MKPTRYHYAKPPTEGRKGGKRWKERGERNRDGGRNAGKKRE